LETRVRSVLDTAFLERRGALIRSLFRIVRCEHIAEERAQESYLRAARTIAQRPVEHPGWASLRCRAPHPSDAARLTIRIFSSNSGPP
jgi:DNA-directed RNA polymerase specialized sigma24 family protein